MYFVFFLLYFLYFLLFILMLYGGMRPLIVYVYENLFVLPLFLFAHHCAPSSMDVSPPLPGLAPPPHPWCGVHLQNRCPSPPPLPSTVIQLGYPPKLPVTTPRIGNGYFISLPLFLSQRRHFCRLSEANTYYQQKGLIDVLYENTTLFM